MRPSVLARKEQENLFGPGVMLPEICLELRAAVNGMADPWPKDKVLSVLGFLRRRLDAWEEKVAGKAVDDAVKQLVAATIAEVEHYGCYGY